MDYKEIAEKYFKVARELREASFTKISELMEGKQRVSLDYDDLWKYDLDPICVTTDDKVELTKSISHDVGGDFIIVTENGCTYLSMLDTPEVYELCCLLDAYFDAVNAK